MDEEAGETWVFALDLDSLARVVGTSRARLVAILFPSADKSEAEDDEEEEDEEESRRKDEGGVAVITAARRPSKKKGSTSEFERTPKELLQVGGRSVICHSLRSLERARFDTAIVLVGYRGREIGDHVRSSFRARGGMRVEVASLGEDWRGTHAESVLRAKPILERHCGPNLSWRAALLVTSDHLFDPSLLRDAMDGAEGDALLVEGDLPETTLQSLPPTAVRVRTSLFHENEDEPGDPSEFWCERVGRKIDDHDAIDAGLVRLGGPNVFDALARLAKRGRYFALCEALDAVARHPGLRAVFADGRPWLAVETEEQYDRTRVLLASPTFRDKVPVEVHYKARAPPPRLTGGPDAADDDAAQPLAHRRLRHYSITSDDGESVLTLPDAAPDALLVAERDGVAALVQRDEARRALAEKARADDEPDYQRLLLASTGLRDVDDLRSVALEKPDSTTTRAVCEVVVARRAPAVGWLVLAAATASQAAGALVFSGDATVEPLVATLWRPLAAAVCVSPLVAARRLVARADDAIHDKPASPAAVAPHLAACCLAFWLSNAAYQLAFLDASSPAAVVLLGSLTPLFVILARALGLYDAANPPTTPEGLGTALGLAGALVCALAAPSPSSSTPPDAAGRDLLAVALTLFSVLSHAAYSILTKTCRAAFSAPDLHLLMQLGAIALNLALLLLLHPRALPTLLSADPRAGALGLFAKHNRADWLFCGLVVDTVGTMGFVVALLYFDPLVTTIAGLFEPICAVLENAAANGAPLPNLAYCAGSALLLAGAGLVVSHQAHTTRRLSAAPAISATPAAPPRRDHPAATRTDIATLSASTRVRVNKLLAAWRHARRDTSETRSLLARKTS